MNAKNKTSRGYGPKRRQFLATAGTTLLLPWLESLARPARAFARPRQNPSPPPLRFLAYYLPCGIHMPGFTPQTTGALEQLPPILAPLHDAKSGIDLRPHVRVVSGLANNPSRPDGPGDHAAGTAGFLTCTHVHKSETDIKNNISLDQVYAQHIGNQTALKSLQLGIDGGGNAGNCDSGYSCAYARNISWAGPTQPLPKITAPQLAFDLLFAGHDTKVSQVDRERRKALRLSVLDAVMQQSQSLQKQLGKQDRDKLAQYMTGVRELERRIQNTAQQSCDLSKFSGDFSSYPEHVQVMTELMVLALQCDATRAITFMLGNGGSYRSHPFLGIPESHHDLSHHGNDAATQAKLQTINHWEIAQFAALLSKMQAVKEGDSTLLDNSVVFLSSEIEDGNSHSHANLPVLVAGHAGGKIKAGGHMPYPDQPMANLFISILHALGLPQSRFGDDGTAPLTGFLG